MSRIFLSHSSNDNDSAVALRDWLAAQGWDDVFLDLDPVLGLAPGERWQNALKLAADRCEAVLFLISPNWLSSRWCLSEFLLAKQLGKRLFPIIVGDVSIASLPLEMSSDHQVVDIVHDPHGWEKLKHGLKRAGLDADSFTFPAGRRIYPGFEPLTEDDAAIFFGRDAQILRGLDRLRLMRDAGAERMMVIVGASGAGKSSFLRAGLWPRLRRDDRNFWPLPVIRPERAALSGRSGLHAAFEGALADPRISAHPALASFPRSRASLGDILSSEGPERLLAAIRLAAAPLSEGMSSPTLVLCIDQAEELFDQEGGEGDSFLRLLAATLETTSHLLVILSIRSDAYPSLQIEPRLAKIAREPFDLPPMPESSLRAVIEGPARFAVPPLKLEPAFVDALLADAKGQDALPLMAFTLNRLTREYGADHALALNNYESSGGLRGAIGAAVNEALDRARGSVSRDERELETLLRQAFVPHLARVNEAGEFARRIALATEIPPPSRALVDVLIEARLLIRDRSARGEMIEVAHEALLREWPLLRRFLDADRDFLVGKRQLADDLAIWRDASSERKVDALLTGLRLTRAQQWLIEREPHELSDDERAFIRESVHAAQATQRRRARLAMAVMLLLAAFSVLAAWQWTKARHEADIAEQEKRHATDETERAKAASEAASRNADLAKTNERLAITAARKAQRGESLTLAQESLDESAHGDIGGAIRTALGAFPADLQRPDRPFEPRAEFALAKAIFADRLIYSLTPVQDKVNAAAYSPDGRLIATGTRDGLVTLWDSSSGQLIRSFSESKRAVFGVAFSPDGQLIAASYEDPVSIVVREVATGNRLWDQPAIGWIPHLLFTPDSKRLITAASSWDQRPRVWDARTGGQIFTLDRNTSQSAATHWVALSPSGRYFASGTSFVGDQEVVVWDMTTGRVVLSNAPNIATDAHPGSFNFEPDETPLWGGFAGDSEDLILRSTGLIYEVNPGNGTIVRRTRFSYEDKIFSSETGLSADGSRMAIATSSTELSVLDAKSGSRLATLRGHISPIQNVALSNDGKLVAASAADHSIRVWDVATTKEIAHLEGHREFTIVSRFSADKRRLLSFGDRSARVWDVGPDWRRWSAGLPDGWRFVTIDPNGTRAIVEHQKVDGDPTPDNVDEIGLWDVTDGRTLRRIKNTSRLKAHVDKNAFSPDGRFVALRFDFYDKESTQEEDNEREKLTELVTRGLLEPDSLPADGTGFFEIIDVQSGETKHVLASDGHPYNFASGVRWAPDGEMIVLGTPQGSEDDEKSASSIEIWKTVARRLLARIDQQGAYDGKAHFSADMKKVSVQTRLSSDHTRLSVLDLPGATNRLSIELATSKSARFAAGDRILTGGEDTPPALLDAASGKPIGNIAKEQVKVTNAFISDDETRLLVQRDSSPVSLWDLTTRKLLAYLPDEKTAVMNASFSGDGTKILVRSFKANVGNTFDIFDARDGTHTRSFGPFPFTDGYGLNSYFLSRTGKYLAVSTSAPHVTIWHVEDGTSTPEIVLNGRLQRWRFTYGDQRLVTADSSGQLQVFDTASGRLVSKIDDVDREAALGDAPVGEKDISIIFSPGNGVGVLDTSTGAVTSRISQAGKIRSAWLSPDSSVLLAVTPDQAGFYALPKGEQIASIPLQGDELNSVSSIQDGQRIFLHTRKGVVALLDVPGRKIVGIYHSDLAGARSSSVILFNGKAEIQSAGEMAHEAALPISNGSIEIRNAVTGEIEHRIELPRPVKRFTLSQVNGRLVVVTEDNSVLSVDVHSGTYHEVLASKSSVYPITWVHPGASDSLLVYDNANQLTLRNWSDGIPITQFPTQWPAEGTWLSALDPSGRYVAVRSPDNVVRVSRIADGSLASVFLWGDEQVVAFAFNSDGNVLAVLSASGKLGLWNIAQNKAENVIALAGQYQTYPAPTMSLGPGNAQLIVADSEGRVSVVSLVTHDVRVFASGAKEPYVVARVSPDGRFLATYAPSYGLRVWSLGLSEVLLETKPGWSELGSYDMDLRFSADSAFVILQSSYEPSTMIRLPEERDALIRTARRHLANFAAANDNLVQPQASKLRLGVLTSDLTAPIRTQFHLPDIKGAVVLDIFGNNAALAAGLKFGDVITKINDTEITGSASVQAAVNAADTSKNVDIVVLRNGETRRFVTNF